MLEHTEILKIINKVNEAKAETLAERIHLLDIMVLQYQLLSEARHLSNMKDQIIKFIQEILPEFDTEDWLIKLFREDPVSAIRLNHAIIQTLKIEEVPYFKKIPDVLFNHIYENEPLSPGSSIILYQALEKTKEDKYEERLIENVEKLTGQEKIKCLAICYLITRDEDYLTQAYELIIPIDDLSKGESLDYIIWEVTDFNGDRYPTTPEFRTYARKKVEKLLAGEVSDLESIHFAIAYVLGETQFWGEEIFGKFTPHIEDYLKLLVDKETGAAVIGRSQGLYRRIGLKGTMDIGKISERPQHGIGHFARKILLDCTQPHVIFISGHRGSGKSYTMGVIAEELATAEVGIGAIVIDPLGVYWSMKYPNWEDKELKLLKKWNLAPRSFADKVRVFVPLGHFNLTPKETKDEAFSIKPSELSVDDWTYVFKIGRFSPRGILIEKVLKLVREGYEAELEDSILKVRGKGDNYSIQDIIRCINTSTFITDKDKGFTRQTRRAMVSRFEIAKEWGIFSVEGTPLVEMSKPNQIAIIDVSMLDEGLHALISGILARKILRARLHMARQTEAAKISVDQDSEKPETIPVTWLLIDEAHLLVPARGSTAATEPLIQYAKLGRKPGCALVLCTQQPSATNTQILSQMDISITHFLTYSSDIDAFAQRAPGEIPSKIRDSAFFRSLPVGVGVIADESITTNRVFVARIRPRISQHAGREALPSIIDSLDRPVVSHPPPSETDSLPETSTSEQETDDGTYITLPPSEGSAQSPVDLPSSSPTFEINLPKAQLKDYMKRLLLYKYRRHIYPPGDQKIYEKISFHTLTEDPSYIFNQIQDILLQKEWIIDEKIIETDLPVLLVSKGQIKIAISIAKLIDSNESIVAFVGTTPYRADRSKLQEIFNTLIAFQN
ncbi:MAG: ATP-binding protein [Candidatus Helarchaeota archaeon]